MDQNNFFEKIPNSFPEEIFETILDTDSFRLERILSSGQSTPDGKWYDQAQDEWVLVLQGKARLKFEDDADIIELKPGDHLLIPAHRKHRVEWTDPSQKTIWLALHF